MTKLFQYRFNEGGLEGHSFGNLFIAAMSEVTGNFEDAVRETSRVLAVRGQILPSTLANVTLSALTEDDEAIHGESQITERGGRIRRVYINPENALANPDAIRAILAADMIVIGPGSLYTSVLPNLLVEGISRALEMAKAVKIYVCNVATQHGETDAFTVSDHCRAIYEHVPQPLFTYVLANSNIIQDGLKRAWHAEPVRTDADRFDGATVIAADVVSEGNRYHHDTEKLAAALMNVYYQRRQYEVLLPQAQVEVEPERQEAAVL
jgi:uncharacterized cofD-like protein